MKLCAEASNPTSEKDTVYRGGHCVREKSHHQRDKSHGLDTRGVATFATKRFST